MTKIIELAHALGEEIAKSAEIDNLEVAKGAFESDTALQEKMREYETQRTLLGEEFVKADSADQEVIARVKERITELTKEISSNEKYQAFAKAQEAMNSLMADVNAEIKFCITGERPSSCTHDCSTCSGCHG
jgi:cell fate (sporulation/competence/biofilm development) regulator YlbF (YheA/YmcA/DUF963 family)